MRFGYTLTIVGLLGLTQALPEASLQRSVDPAINQALGHSKTVPLNNTAFTCKVLDIALGGGNASVAEATDSTYSALEDVNYSATCWLPAACIVSPKNASEVARIIKITSYLQTKFAVRSGGHKDTPGFASVDGSGILISLTDLDTISLASDNSTLIVGPGCRWQDVYDVVVPQNRIVVGGRVGIVGVAGFLLGGGISYYANHYGLAVDNIKRFEVVLGNGTIVTASASQNTDLFRGLRGGATNYGIVTSFELYTYPLGDIYFEARSYQLNETAAFLRAFAQYQFSGQLDPLSSVTVQIQPTGPVVLFQYAKPVAGSSSFDAFKDVPYTSYLPPTNGTLLDLLVIAGAGFATGDVRTYGETFSHKVDGDFMVQAYDIFSAEIAKLPAGAAGVWVPTALAATVATQGKTNGGNLLGLSEIPQQWHEWFITWTDSTQDAEIYALSRNITEKLTAAAKEKDVLLPYLFMNTAGTTQDVLSSFGSDNVKVIKEVAHKYDPGKVFQTYQNDGYLLRKLS